jgi:hypothetical protein
MPGAGALDGCSFGDCKIASRPGKVALFYDNAMFTSRNLFDVAMEFGDLIITGKINFNDTAETHNILKKDRQGNLRTETYTTVAATMGYLNLDVARKVGTSFVLSALNGNPTIDDIQLRKLIAFLELMTYDLFAE